MKRVAALLLAIALCACQERPATDTMQTAPAPRQKNSAEKAFDAGQDARKKAERIKAEEEKKAKEAMELSNQ